MAEEQAKDEEEPVLEIPLEDRGVAADTIVIAEAIYALAREVRSARETIANVLDEVRGEIQGIDNVGVYVKNSRD